MEVPINVIMDNVTHIFQNLFHDQSCVLVYLFVFLRRVFKVWLEVEFWLGKKRE